MTRVLIVDDCRDSARSLRLLLGLLGFEAHLAGDGPEALRLADELHPDVVLLDLTLPGLSGLEVAEALRRDPSHAATRIIAVSGYARERLPEPSPFDDHLTKPVDLGRLLQALQGPRDARDP